jgi:hypothetical protein
MLFTNVFTYATALAATVPTVAGFNNQDFKPKYIWDANLRVYKLGEIPSRGKNMPNRAADWLGRCSEGDITRGADIGLGSYGCGEFKDIGMVIYKCVKDKETGEPWLKRYEVCLWAGAGPGGQCVRNQRKKGKKFYPLVDSSKIVCVQPSDL